MTLEENRRLLKALIENQKMTSYVTGYDATDAEALGLLIAHYFEWDGLAIMETAYSALEDANYHTENVQVEAMIARAKQRLSLVGTEGVEKE